GFQRMRWSRPRIADLETATTSFESIASVTQTSIAIQTVGTARGEDVARGFSRASLPEQIEGEIVSPNYFRTLRVNPAAGRTFAPEEDLPPGAAPVALIGDSLARTRYHGSAVGATIRLNDSPLTIVGVMPPGFRGLSGKANVWIPRSMAPALTYAGYLTTPQ